MGEFVGKNVMDKVVPSLFRFKKTSFLIAVVGLFIVFLTFAGIYYLTALSIFDKLYYVAIITIVIALAALYAYKVKSGVALEHFLLYLWQAILIIVGVYFVVGVPFSIVAADFISNELLVG